MSLCFNKEEHRRMDIKGDNKENKLKLMDLFH